MKNAFLSTLVFLTAFHLVATAQCVVNETEDNFGVYPSELPMVCVGSDYSESATVVGFRDTVYAGFTVPIDSMKLNAVSGLPSGLNWSCGVSDCTDIPSGLEPPRLCFSVEGSVSEEFPTTTVEVEVTQWITLFGFPIELTDTLYATIGSSSVDTAVTVAGMTLISSASNATYQWLDCDNAMNPIPNETSPSYTSAASGSFAVEVTQGGCTLVSDCYPVSGLGLNHREFESFFRVFPNPSEGQVNITISENTRIKFLHIIGLDGRLVHSVSISQLNRADIAFDLSQGVYMVQAILLDGRVMSHRIIICAK